MHFGLALSLTLGLLFLVTAFTATFVSFKVAGYPIDEATKRRQGPAWVIGLDHVLWWVFLLLYLVMMSEMMPRLWHYQVELPPRTVAHVIVGISVGVALIVKISFERFFRHMQEWVPGLAAALLGGTILLSGLSVPFALREFGLAQSAVGGGVYSQENRDRVAKLLPQAEMPEDVDLAALTTVQALQAGRDVLAGKCVVCHDLKTILVQPRTPSAWWKTVDRMASKPSFAEPLTDEELHVVTAYLIAISGELQRSVKERKAKEEKRAEAVADIKVEARSQAAAAAGNGGGSGGSDLPPFDAAAAAKTYETLCAQCHDLKDIEARPPKDSEEIKNVIIRMIAVNGLEAKKEELDLVYLHMVTKFAGGKLVQPKPAEKAPESTVPAEAVPPEATPPAGGDPKEVAEAPVGKPETKEKPVAKPKAPTIDGKPLYEKFCKSCHAVDGKGSASMKAKNVPDFTTKSFSKGKIVAALTNGVPGTLMKDFKAKLSADEMAAVAAYIKKLK